VFGRCIRRPSEPPDAARNVPIRRDSSLAAPTSRRYAGGKRLARFRDPAAGTYERVDEPDIAAAIEPRALPDMNLELGAVFTD
jgi:hypothetical protein